jgi:hypothetical protein
VVQYRAHMMLSLVGSMLLIVLVFYVVLFISACFRHVSCVPNAASVSGLIIRYYPFDFL